MTSLICIGTAGLAMLVPLELTLPWTLVLLTLSVTPLAVLWAGDRLHLALLVSAQALSAAFFMTTSLLGFYVLFESILIPLTLLVGLYGSTGRIRAAYLLWAYTIIGSIGLFLVVAYLELGSGSEFTTLAHQATAADKGIWLAMLLALAVKTPLWPVHLWLGTVHSEAPLSTSLLLAAIVLKFATYGHWLLLTTVFTTATDYYAPLLVGLAGYSLIYASVTVLRLVDTKAIVAMSSVGHMGLATMGLYGGALSSALLLSVGHAFSSIGLFIITGGVIYDRYHTRLLRHMGGLLYVMPVASLALWALSCCSIGLPPTVGWVAEFGLLAGLWRLDIIAAAIAALSMLLTTTYSFWLVTRVTLGQWTPTLSVASDSDRAETIGIAYCAALCLALGLWPLILP